MVSTIKLHDDFAESGYLEQAPSFTNETAQQLFSSDKQFPVPMDYAGQWAGYSRRDNALRGFRKCGFVENVDYQVVSLTVEENSGGRPRKDFKLSVLCLKEFFAASHTKQGKEYRKYLISAEEQLQEVKQKGLLSSEVQDSFKFLAQVAAQTQQLAQGLLAGQSQLSNRMDSLVADVESLKRKDALEVVSLKGYFTTHNISAYKLCKNNAFGIEFENANELMKEIGVDASKYCKKNDIAIEKISDVRWGSVNAYPIEILDIVVSEYLPRDFDNN